MKLENGEVDVFIYKFLEEQENEQGEKDFLYQFNQFRSNEENVSEKDIKKDPYSYLEYDNKELTQTEKIEQLERKVVKLEKEIENLKQ